MPKQKFKPLAPIPLEILERLWYHIEVRGPDECWPWTSATSHPFGYGTIQTHHPIYKKLMAHRVAYYLQTSVDPEQLNVCHRCDNPPCCNAGHLFLGTAADNRLDCVHKRRHNFGGLHGRALLDESKVQIIWGLYGSGISTRKIAKQFGVSRSTIQEITRGATWKHVNHTS